MGRRMMMLEYCFVWGVFLRATLFCRDFMYFLWLMILLRTQLSRISVLNTCHRYTPCPCEVDANFHPWPERSSVFSYLLGLAAGVMPK